MRESREFKSFPMHTKATGDRTRVGIAAVFGNTDAIDDRIHAGAFLKTITEGRQRQKHLWQHDFGSPPIASIKQLREITRDELPPEVLAYAPEAMGGLEVTREYYRNNPLADWVLQAIDAGDINEMSIGFDATKFDWSTVGEGAAQRRIRELRELTLYDTSDVNWGMNPSTVGAKSGMPLDLVAQSLAALVRDIKAGRRNATSDLSLINAIHRASIQLGCDECKGLIEEEKAEAVPSGTSLSRLRSDVQQLEIDAI